MVKCEQCGYENPLGHLYCMKCRARLEFKTRADTEMLRMPGERRFGTRQAIIGAAAAVAALIAVLPFWPAAVPPGAGGADNFKSACRKLNILSAGPGTSAGPGAGVQVFTESEVNAYMTAVFARAEKSTGSGLFASKLRSVSLSLRKDVVVVNVSKVTSPVAIGPLKFGPFKSTYALSVVPRTGSEGFRFVLKSGRRGHLPLPAIFMRPAFSEIAEFFSDLTMERAFLERIGGVEVVNGSVSVSMKR